MKAKMVNELKNTAILYHDHQSLRERMINILIKHMKDDWYTDTNSTLEGLIEDIELRDKSIQKLKNCYNCSYKKGIYNRITGSYFHFSNCYDCDDNYSNWG